MKISSLWNKYKDSAAVIFGSGPSLRFCNDLLPVFRQNCVTIGLNKAFETLNFDPHYNLTIHPELIPHDTKLNWVTKRKDWLRKKDPKSGRFFWFENNKDVHDYAFINKTEGRLYVGRGIHTAAIALAAQMGVRTAFVVGCDMNQVGGDHHATSQSVRFHGIHPSGVYREYYLNAVAVRKKVHDLYGMNVLQLNPYLGLGYHQEDYEYLEAMHNLAPLRKGVVDDSDYQRKQVDFL